MWRFAQLACMKTELLIIGATWPEPNSTAAGVRMMELIQLFLDQGWKLTFASAAAEGEHTVDLEALGIDKVSIKLNDSSFNTFIKDLNPDIVMFDRFMTEEQFGWRVAEQCPNAMRILDTEDLHFLRLARRKVVEEEQEFSQIELFSDIAKREAASIYRCDLSLIISTYEMELLKSVFKIDKSLLHHLPFMLDPITERERKDWALWGERLHFVTIGNALHPPNYDAVKYLKMQIWPFIRKALPTVEMHIYGAYPNDKVKALHDPKKGFKVMGRAKNAEEVIGSARVMLSPLRFGAGLKGKLVMAMQCGTPSVTTDIGAEGMHGDLPWSGTVTNTPIKFAKAAVQLYTDRAKWVVAQKNGIEIVNTIFPKDKLSAQLLKRIEKIRGDLKTHRQQNFIGSMMMFHTLRSTEFMGRWIEAKNANEGKTKKRRKPRQSAS